MSLFDGISGRLVAKAMARMNADAENEAVSLLAPKENDLVLAIGFGPGVGLEFLLRRPVGLVVGVDPSAVMNKIAGDRNGAALKDGRLILLQKQIEHFDPEFGPFDGAIAVHTLQICNPIEPTAGRLYAALKPGARLISITHAWAAEKDFGTVERFVTMAVSGLSGAGFGKVTSGKARAERGSAILIEAVR